MRINRALTPWTLLATVLMAAAPRLHAQTGLPLWTNRFGGPGGYDQPFALAVDSSGNVIVTGYISATNGHSDMATIKCSAAGVPLWTNIYNDADHNDCGNAVAVNGSGDVFVTGYSVVMNGPYLTSHYTTLAYSSSGAPLWTNRYAYGNTLNSAAAVAVTRSGNVVVTGSSVGGQMRYSYATVAYSSTGEPLWTNRYNSGVPVELDAYAVGIAADTNGNVFVTGYATAMGSGYDYATIKYSPTGARLWINRYNGSANGADYARAIAVDGIGNVFVTGYSSNSLSGYDYTTIAYANDATPLWTNFFNGPQNGHDYARAIAVDDAGNIFVTGYSTNSLTGAEYATVAYSNSGVPLWTNLYRGAEDADGAARAIGVDRGGNVFVTGYSSNLMTSCDYVTVAYSNVGLPLLTNIFGSAGAYYDQAAGLAVDRSGNVFVTGISFGSSQDYTTIKYPSLLPPPPSLAFEVVANQMRLYWTNSQFALQSAPDLAATFTNVPGATSPHPVSISAPRQFFRLISLK